MTRVTIISKKLSKQVRGGVIGLAVSQKSHNVYMTTYNQELEAWDTDTWKQIDAEDIGAGAGVCVAEEGYVPPFGVEKIDDIDNCTSPRGEEITYTISIDYQWDEVGYPDPNIFESIEVVDYLPAEVNFDRAQPGGTYDPNYHSYTWTLTDSNSFGDTLSLELVVQSQNERITPGGMIENNVEVTALINEGNHVSRFTLQTPVCDCTGYTGVIYVDENAPDPCDGSSWDKAFDKLQDALAVALPCDEIWVADGTYKPTQGSDPNFTFELVNGVGVYGGFEGTEEHRYERDWGDPCKTAVLSGDIAGDEDSYYVVTSDADVEVACLDGFTIKRGSVAGVYCKEGSPIIQHNKITASGTGIYCEGTEQPTFKNNWIYRNNYGLYIEQAANAAVVRNNTVVYNDEVGIFFESGIKPLVTNCILWGNGDESIETQLNWEYLEGLFVRYSCIQDSNDVTPQPPYYTINTDPCFAYASGDDYHLEGVSACIDAGDPNSDYTGERDIDKHFRLLDGNDDDEKRVDMGADEYCNQGSSNDADFNEDGVVNNIDFAIFANAWLSENDPCDERWNGSCDLVTNDIIDVNDLAAFAQEWLWMSCEGMKGIPMMEMMMGADGGESMLLGEAAMIDTVAQASETEAKPQAEPSIEEQIEQIKYFLDWLDEIKDQIEEEIWLNLTASFEEMLKELEDSQ